MSYRSDQEQSDSKQKVTLYLSPELHRNLKIHAAVEMESMSKMAEKALSFYLDHSEVFEGIQGSTHQVHRCPKCSHPFVLRQGEVSSLPEQANGPLLLDGSEADFSQSTWGSPDSQDQPKHDELVPC